MKAVWRLFKRQITWMAIIATALGYSFAVWGAWAMRDPDQITSVAHFVGLSLMYGTLTSVVLFVLMAGVLIPRSAYYSASSAPGRSLQITTCDVDVLDEMAEARSDRQSRNLGMWGSTDDLPPVKMMGDDF